MDQLTQVWHGSDADEFRGWWEQQHRPALQQASSAVQGLGQTALKNAEDQLGVSQRDTSASTGSPGIARGDFIGSIAPWVGVAMTARGAFGALESVLGEGRKGGFGPIDVLSIADSGFRSVQSFRRGDIDGGVRSAIDVGWSLASKDPRVVLGKLAWDGGWALGNIIDGGSERRISGPMEDGIWGYAQSHGYDKDPNRYDGVVGAGNFAHDFAGATIDSVKDWFKL